jgi:hypothetical protein
MEGQEACMRESSSADGTAISTAERTRPGYRSEGIEDVACVRVVMIDWSQGKDHDVRF